MKQKIVLLAAIALLIGGLAPTAHAALVEPDRIGINEQTRSDNYDMLVEDFFSNDRIVTTVGDSLWVPWFSTSSRSEVGDLHAGNSCNSGQNIDFNRNCMVTDEFSQVGILVAMGRNQQRMNQFYNAVIKTQSTNGMLPSWRIYRDGNTIEPCRLGINSNCDSASDASARMIIALYTASENPYFTDQARKDAYARLATTLANDMLEYEVLTSCQETSRGTICNWLAGGSEVKRAGFEATNFGYTGYYPDAIIAMLAAYSHTGEERYARAAKDFTANYMQAARFDGRTFTAPPGMAFKWVADGSGELQAECTNSCGPVMWDSHDAPRAIGMCQAQYYADLVDVELPQLKAYCDALSSHMNDPTRAPLQFTPDGTPHNIQSSHFAQGLQALHQMGANPGLFEQTLDRSLSHYSTATKSFDYAPAFGVYTQNFAVRALGVGIGRDRGAFGARTETVPGTNPQPRPPPVTAPEPTSLADMPRTCTLSSGACEVHSDATNGVCRAIVWRTSLGNIQVLGCQKDGGYIEVYRQSAPNGIAFSSCIGSGCVTQHQGFARFKAETSVAPPVNEVPETTPEPEPRPQPEPTPPKQGVGALSARCSLGGSSCSLVSDSSTGACRTVVWSTASGNVQLQACGKDDGFVEVYRQQTPSAPFSACLGDGCIDQYRGFDRFNP